MSFVVDFLPPSEEIEAATALALAMAARKSRGLLGRRQDEAVEVIARIGLPLLCHGWNPADAGTRCLVFEPFGMVSGAIRFDLAPLLPDPPPDPEAGEEAFLDLCRQWTKRALDVTPAVLEFAGLLTPPDQVVSLLAVSQEPVQVSMDEKADAGEALARLNEQLEQFSQSAEAWKALHQNAYAHRDVLADKLQRLMEEERAAGARSLEELARQGEEAVAARKAELEAAWVADQQKYRQRRDLLQSELERFQDGYKESGDAYWRQQIKDVEKSIAENDKWLAQRRKEYDQAEREFIKKQQARLGKFRARLDKRLAAYETRLKRLNAAMDGLSKAVEQRLALYQQQPGHVLAATVELPAQRRAQPHNAVFVAARYGGGRWQVFPPQQLASRKILGGLLGRTGLPFRPASPLAEALAEKLQQLLPGSALAENLVAANLLEQEDFLARAQAGLDKLATQGKLDKRQVRYMAELLAAAAPQPARDEEDA
ncbi:MAG TPA: hypothetical protein PKL39_02940 [Bacillota bacterium]|nr:hypothetical protein [Bacillota bacterium]HPZ91445.1 hypothetical protein [Bacillota bacterium]HQE02708.1 hypothetical protein [Bacillota bacterium]